jgi:hypothetical protein
MGERALPPPLAVAWPQIVYNGDCAAPTHTDIYTYYRVRGSHVLLLSVCRSVGRLCACLWVWGCGCCPHTRYSGLCCCCCLATAAPLHQEAAVCIWQQQALNSIMPCLCVDAISHISGVCVCVCLAHAHTHAHATTNSLQHPHTHAYEQSRMHSKGNMYMCMNTVAQYMHLYNFYIYLSRPQVERLALSWFNPPGARSLECRFHPLTSPVIYI